MRFPHIFAAADHVEALLGFLMILAICLFCSWLAGGGNKGWTYTEVRQGQLKKN